MNPENWQPADLSTLVNEVIEAVESGEIGSALDNVEMTARSLARTKSAKNVNKNDLMACITAGAQGVSQAQYESRMGVGSCLVRRSCPEGA